MQNSEAIATRTETPLLTLWKRRAWMVFAGALALILLVISAGCTTEALKDNAYSTAMVISAAAKDGGPMTFWAKSMEPGAWAVVERLGRPDRPTLSGTVDASVAPPVDALAAAAARLRQENQSIASWRTAVTSAFGGNVGALLTGGGVTGLLGLLAKIFLSRRAASLADQEKLEKYKQLFVSTAVVIDDWIAKGVVPEAKLDDLAKAHDSAGVRAEARDLLLSERTSDNGQKA